MKTRPPPLPICQSFYSSFTETSASIASLIFFSSFPLLPALFRFSPSSLNYSCPCNLFLQFIIFSFYTHFKIFVLSFHLSFFLFSSLRSSLLHFCIFLPFRSAYLFISLPSEAIFPSFLAVSSADDANVT